MAFDNYTREFVGIPETATPPGISMLIDSDGCRPTPIVIPDGDYTFNRAGHLVPADSPDAVSYVAPPGMRVTFDGLTRQYVDGNFVREFTASEADPEDDDCADDEELDEFGDDDDGDDDDGDECAHGYGPDEDCPKCDGDGDDSEDEDADLDDLEGDDLEDDDDLLDIDIE